MWQLFDEMPHPDVVSRTVLTMGYGFGEMYDDALLVFEQMQYAGVVPNQLTMVNALAACASSGAIEMGICIHDIGKGEWMGIGCDFRDCVDWYECQVWVFTYIKEKHVFTWNAVIKGPGVTRTLFCGLIGWS